MSTRCTVALEAVGLGLHDGSVDGAAPLSVTVPAVLLGGEPQPVRAAAKSRAETAMTSAESLVVMAGVYGTTRAPFPSHTLLPSACRSVSSPEPALHYHVDMDPNAPYLPPLEPTDNL